MFVYKNMFISNEESLPNGADLGIINERYILNKKERLTKFPKGQLQYINTIDNIDYFKIVEREEKQEEKQYLQLLHKLVNLKSDLRPDRTGTYTKSIFGHQMRFSLKNNQIPIITTKYTNIHAVITELIWFLNGDTNTQFLKDNNVHIWDGNSTRQFLDNRGLNHLPEGDIGLGYGYQWRKFNGRVDQITNLINGLRTDPYGRRHILTAWNPDDLDKMALPPCHCFAQFYISDNENGTKKELSCHLYQRSVDVFLGLPFNIMSYSVLTYLIATYLGFECGEFIISTGDTHIYSNHIDSSNECLKREPLSKPFIFLNKKKIKSSDNLYNLSIDDITIKGYLYHPMIKADMAI